MTDDDRIVDLVRASLAPSAGERPSSDLWPSVVARLNQPAAGPWLDIGLAAAIAAALLIFPQWALLLAYHL
jgi:hypothetical protein